MTRNALAVVCLCGSAAGLATADDVPEAARTAKAQYDAAVADLLKPYTKTTADATAEYAKQIADLFAKAKETGDLDAVLALKTEQGRIAGGEGSPGKLPADAAKAYRAYEAAVTKARSEYESKSRAIHAGYVRDLTDLEKAETMALRVDSAVAVRAYRQQVATEGPPLPAGNPVGSAFGHRFGAEKARLIAVGGGTAESEQAVVRGLAWLARQQKPNGSWVYDGSHADDTIAATGMALLPFLAAGETHKAGKKYASTVERGLKYLIANQAPTGKFTGKGLTMYTHGIATLALCEAYGMTKDKGFLLRPAQIAINFIVQSQAADGSWGYQPGTAGDTSIVGWQVQALKAAQLSRDVVFPNATTQKVVAFLDKVTSGETKAVYGYTAPNGAPGTSLTAVGLLCRCSINKWASGNAGLTTGVEGLLKRGPRAAPAKPDMYYYYYATQVVRLHDGPGWKDWNEGPVTDGMRQGGMRDWLVKLQNKQTGASFGCWDSDGGTIGTSCGRVGTTALSLLTLEVYYRNAPGPRRDTAELSKP